MFLMALSVNLKNVYALTLQEAHITQHVCFGLELWETQERYMIPLLDVNDANSESFSVDDNENDIEYPGDLLEIQGYTNPRRQSQSVSQIDDKMGRLGGLEE
jgi:hypothetical protein